MASPQRRGGGGKDSYPSWGAGYNGNMAEDHQPQDLEKGLWEDFSDTPEDQDPEYIAGLLNKFVDAWWAVQDATKRADERRPTIPPHLSQGAFETVADLAEYNRIQAELRKVDADVRTAAQDLADVSRLVAEVLPPDTTVVHSYSREGEAHAGRHRISHSESSTPKIRLDPLNI